VPTEGASGEQADSASAEAKSDQAQPEQPNKSGGTTLEVNPTRSVCLAAVVVTLLVIADGPAQ